MKLVVKYLFPTSSPGSNFYNYQLPEGQGMRNILGHHVRTQKNPQTMAKLLVDFHRFSWSYVGPNSNLHSCVERELFFCKKFFKTYFNFYKN